MNFALNRDNKRNVRTAWFARGAFQRARGFNLGGWFR